MLDLAGAMQRIQEAALRAVDPEAAVRAGLRVAHFSEASAAICCGEAAVWDLHDLDRVLLVAVGKAAVPMARAASAQLGHCLTGGVVVTKSGHAAGAALPRSLEVVEAGHPVPDENGQRGAERVRALLTGLTPRDGVLVLLSGGASALLPAPVAGVTLAALQTLTGALLRAGATIHEINAVRKHLDELKGGGLARRARPARLAALILSDVVGDQLDVIASGPTAPDPTTYQDAWAVLTRYGLTAGLPPAIAAHLQAGLAGERAETPKPDDPDLAGVVNVLIGSNRLAARAAAAQAEQLGFRSLLLSTFVEGEAREVARVAAALARGVRAHGDPLPAPACLVWGGETTVTVRGQGRGGRNQELALAAALALEGLPDVLLLALATDGTDGPTDAAGGLVDGDTVRRMRAAGVDPAAALADNDAYPALAAAAALVRTGPTGTNVNDLLVLLVR